MEKLRLIYEAQTSTTELVKLCLSAALDSDKSELSIQEITKGNFRFKLSNKDINLFVRFADPASIGTIQELIASKISYGYLIDDNFWMLHGDSALEKFYQNPFVRSCLEIAISGAKVVFCHTPIYRDFLLKYNKNVVIVPTFFDFNSLDTKGSIDELSQKNIEVRIGVVTNISRQKDLEIIVPAILSLLKHTPENVVFEFFGYLPDRLEAIKRVRFLQGHQDYGKFIRLQQARGWLIGLAPLIDNVFSSFKTNNKFRELGGCGVAGIYSDVSIYRQDVKSGVNGWLVDNNPEAWVNAVKNALHDLGATKQIGLAAEKDVRREYSLENVCRKWMAEISLLKQRNSAIGFKRRIIEIVSKYADPHYGESIQIIQKIPRYSFFGLLSWLGLVFPRKLIVVDVEDEISVTVIAPISGFFKWSIAVATFNTQPTGELVIRIKGDSATSREMVMPGSEILDGGHIMIESTVLDGEGISISFLNKTNQRIGFFVLTNSGNTVYRSTKRAIKGRIVA